MVSAPIARADYGEWTWISGADTLLQAGTYGIKGVPAAANVPGARYGSAAWTDSTGNFWLFGGYGLDSIGTENYLNDLWRYDPDNDMWTWMSGSDIAGRQASTAQRACPQRPMCRAADMEVSPGRTATATCGSSEVSALTAPAPTTI